MLSVIVPIYNVGRYLDMCVNSICNQTYTDMEIVLVDDGSTDGCSEICERYRQKDSRVVVIHKENGGLVSARKEGVRRAKGEFIGWVDGDDWIEEDYFEKMMGMQGESGADIVAAGHFHDIGQSRIQIFNHIQPGCYNREDILPGLIYSGEFFEYGLQPHLWNKLVHRRIMESVEMQIDDAVSMGEDVLAVYPSVMKAEKICVTDICAYHYVQHRDSMTKTASRSGMAGLDVLSGSLRTVWKGCGAEEQLNFQLIQYEKVYCLLHQYSVLEKSKFPPYGRILQGSRIIIYGAGVMGRNLYEYYKYQKGLRIIAMIDANWESYCNSGYIVLSPENIREWNGKYDLLLIANSREKTAMQMRDFAVSMGAEERKIRWLTEEFIHNVNPEWRKASSDM